MPIYDEDLCEVYLDEDEEREDDPGKQQLPDALFDKTICK